MDSLRNPLHRPFTAWLGEGNTDVAVLELNGCKRCGPKVCQFVSKLFKEYCGSLFACPEAPPTELRHTFYDSPWIALHPSGAEPSSTLINRVMFAALALDILRNLVHAAQERGIEHVPDQPLVVVIAYLQRHAQPLRSFLEATFRHPDVQTLIAPFDVTCIKVMLLDSARGMTADYVHVVRGSRIPHHHDQYWGIQADTKREYISYTRAKYVCHVWLESQPFGPPGVESARPSKSDAASKGYDHAALRNDLICKQGLPWKSIHGDDRQWSWWYALDKSTPDELCTAIEHALDVCCTMPPEAATILGNHFKDPVCAITGLLTNLRDFLASDLATIRKSGISLAPAPVTIVDPELQQHAAYGIDVALRFAMKIAPALAVDLHTDTEYTQMCIPVLTGPGLDDLGNSIAEEGELMLRAFVLVVRAVFIVAFEDIGLIPFARTHKAEMIEILGERWFSKACRSDREAVGLLDPNAKGSKQVQLYCYLGGGGLTEASTSLAQGVVVKAKTRKMALAVCLAVRILTAAVPGPTAELEEKFCTIDAEMHDDDDDDMEPAASRPTEGVAEFVSMYERKVGWVWGRLGICPSLMHVGHSTLEDAHRALEGLRQPWNLLRQQRQHQ
jgi:hypothetical protein